MTPQEFKEQFEQLTEKAPLSWQERLFHDHFCKKNALPSVIDLPTGLGKTMVMAIWLLAQSSNCQLPRRLIYVVDRRTVVDQATDLAMKLRRIIGEDKLAISTLRGQLADNRAWTRDPSRSAIIIGTVDLIGSGLLFSGYRSSYKRRPLEAGFLGQDTLLVLDEAHLSSPFEQLLVGRDGADGTYRNGIAQFQFGHGNPMQVIRMSATSGSNNGTESGKVFRLKSEDLQEDPDPVTGKERNAIITRFGASKRLIIVPVESTKKNDALAEAAIRMAEDTAQIGKRIVVFVRSPNDAKEIARLIGEHEIKTEDTSGKKPRTIKQTPYADAVKVLTGTMRGLERDEFVLEDVVKTRWLNGDLEPSQESNQRPAFLVSTSAGEVGFDLNADHMVSDQTTIDSFIQRLGRVNRRGTGNATVILIPELIKHTDKEGKPRKLNPLEQAILNTLDLINGKTDVSPKAIAKLKEREWKDGYGSACSPEPTMVELTDILLDSWSMTSIIKPMPGRPEVGPWLRGIDNDLPQTTIAWRAELDEAGFAELELDDIEEWFDTHRILTRETLAVPTTDATKWLTERWGNLSEAMKMQLASRPIIIDRAGMSKVTVKQLIDQLLRKDASIIRYGDIILPASFGGIERGVGLLDADAPAEDDSDTDEETKTDNARARLAAPDVADVGLRWSRLREVKTTNEDGKTEIRVIGNGTKPQKHVSYRLDLESDNDRPICLISYVPRFEKPEFGSKRQTLFEHVNAVRTAVDDILKNIRLPDSSKTEISLAAKLAAEYHDHGKNRERWQRTINGKATVGTTDWLKQSTLEGDGTHQCLGKSGDKMKRDPRGYRHEFGSLREFTDAFNDRKLLDENKKPISQDVFDLAMHLIATHHGRGRPHFPKGGFDPDCEAQSEKIHTEAIRRFAQLQRKYGWWHLAWLENLLRCADALASEQRSDERQDNEPEACQ